MYPEIMVIPMREELTRAGHKVLIQSGAGQGSGISDEQYVRNVVDDTQAAAGGALQVLGVPMQVPPLHVSLFGYPAGHGRSRLSDQNVNRARWRC